MLVKVIDMEGNVLVEGMDLFFTPRPKERIQLPWEERWAWWRVVAVKADHIVKVRFDRYIIDSRDPDPEEDELLKAATALGLAMKEVEEEEDKCATCVYQGTACIGLHHADIYPGCYVH